MTNLESRGQYHGAALPITATSLKSRGAAMAFAEPKVVCAFTLATSKTKVNSRVRIESRHAQSIYDDE